jgi:hypothetical protein
MPKVAGLIPDEVIGYFNGPVTEMGYQESSLG